MAPSVPAIPLTPGTAATPAASQPPDRNSLDSLPLHWLPSAAAIAYLTAASFFWYRHRDSFWGSHDSIVILTLGGVALWGALLLRAARWSVRDVPREVWIVASTALGLFAILWHFGRRPGYSIWFGDTPASPPLARLLPFFYFAASSVLLRVAAPLVVARVTLGLRPADLGYRRPTFDRSGWLYVLAVAIAIPAVAYASTRPAFITKYPLCKQAIEDGALSVWGFAVYQLAYGSVFASGEAFWRGFIAFGLGRRIGYNALFFMLIPYVLGHFGKPQAESLGAIAAGLFLGVLALKHRSFWLGAAVHWSVALMMDFWALHRRGIEWVW